MKFFSQNIQPIRLSVVKITKNGHNIECNFGNEATPFFLERNDASIYIHKMPQAQELKYFNVALSLTDEELHTLFRMDSAVDLGYNVLLNLPLMNLALPVKSKNIVSLLSDGGKNFYYLDFVELKINIPFWRRLWKPSAKSAESWDVEVKLKKIKNKSPIPAPAAPPVPDSFKPHSW